MTHVANSGLLLVAFFASGALGSSADPAPLGERSSGVLIAGGKPCAAIVTPKGSNAAEQYAAADLQDVLRKMTGVTLTIVADDQEVEGNRILVGNTRFTDAVVSRDEREKVGEEGYVVRLRGRDLALAGGGPYGVIYAAAELYDRLGARWYLPGELGEAIPEKDTVRFDRLDVRRQPSFAMRWVGDDEYYWKVNWLDLPWPITHTVSADIPYFKSIGVEGLYTQYTTDSIWGNFIAMYVAARLLWDHATDVPALLNEFYPKFYGKAAEPMRRWHETLESQMAECKVHIPGGAASGAPLVFTERVVAQLKDNLAEAQRLAEDAAVKRRLEKMAILTHYTDRLSSAFRLAEQSAKEKNKKESLRLLKEAYLVGEALRDDLLSRPDYYKGVAAGVYYRNNLYMDRLLGGWRKRLVGERVLKEE
jgi:hypothetical protein